MQPQIEDKNSLIYLLVKDAILSSYEPYLIKRDIVRNKLIEENILYKNQLKEQKKQSTNYNSNYFEKYFQNNKKYKFNKSKGISNPLSSYQLAKGIFVYPSLKNYRSEDKFEIEFMVLVNSYKQFANILNNIKSELESDYYEYPHDKTNYEIIQNEILIKFIFVNIVKSLKSSDLICDNLNLYTIIDYMSAILNKSQKTIFKVLYYLIKESNFKSKKLVESLDTNYKISQLSSLREVFCNICFIYGCNIHIFKTFEKLDNNSIKVFRSNINKQCLNKTSVNEYNYTFNYNKNKDILENNKFFTNVIKEDYYDKNLFTVKLKETVNSNKQFVDNFLLNNIDDNNKFKCIEFDIINCKFYYKHNSSYFLNENIEINIIDSFLNSFYINDLYVLIIIIKKLKLKDSCFIKRFYNLNNNNNVIINPNYLNVINQNILKNKDNSIYSNNITCRKIDLLINFLNVDSLDKYTIRFFNDKYSSLNSNISNISNYSSIDSLFLINNPFYNIFLIQISNDYLPIKKVFVNLSNAMPSTGILPKKKNFENSYYIKGDKKTDYIPCNHDGVCSFELNCPCIKKRGICEKYCSCYPNCTALYKGCNCAFNCLFNCKCNNDYRECDDDICLNCIEKNCGNKNIFNRELPKKLALGKSSICDSLGLYTLEDINEGEYICEYIGEILNKEETERRSIFNDQLGLNYLFQLTETTDIDAYRVGNEMRY